MPVCILYAGNDLAAAKVSSRNYLLNLILCDSFQERYMGRFWLWKISKAASETGQNYSLMIIQVNESHRMLLRSKKWLYIPNWVIGKVDIPKDPSGTKDSSLKSDFRRIRKHSLRFEVTKDIQLFNDFYHNMYLPHVNKAHNNSAIVISYKHMRTGFKNCELLLVTKHDKRIAGILLAHEEVPRLWSLGIRDGNREHIKDGAVGALYYYSLLYLKGNGYRTINFGTSKAFLRDGVLKYKRKWSQRIIGTTSYGYAIKVLSCTDPTKAFLKENPFIFKNHKELQGAVFVDSDKALSFKALKKIDQKHFHDGLTKLNIYCFHDSQAINQDSIPPELSERMVLRSAGDIA